MSETEHLIAQARLQHEAHGLINTSVLARLSALGVDVTTLEKSFEENT